MTGEVDGGVLAVIDAAIAALRGADLEVVGAKAVAGAHDAGGVDAIHGKRAQGAVADAVSRDDGDVRGVIALVREREGRVGFGAAVTRVEARGLLEAEVVRRREAHHDLAKGEDLRAGVHTRSFLWGPRVA